MFIFKNYVHNYILYSTPVPKSILSKFKALEHKVMSLQRVNEREQRNLQKQIQSIKEQIIKLQQQIDNLKEKVKYGKIIVGDNQNKQDEVVVLYDELRSCTDLIHKLNDKIDELSNKNILLEKQVLESKQQLNQIKDNDRSHSDKISSLKIKKLQNDLINLQSEFTRKFKFFSTHIDNLEIIINNLPTEKIRYSNIIQKVNQLETYVKDITYQVTNNNNLKSKLNTIENRFKIFVQEFKGKEMVIQFQQEEITSRDTSFRIIDSGKGVTNFNNQQESGIDKEDLSSTHINSNNSGKKREQVSFKKND